MARAYFQRPYVGPLRSPISPAVQMELTANPLQQAMKTLKGSQQQAPKVPKAPRRKTANPFFGE